MKSLIVILLLALPLVANAATYSWIDKSGTIHFTDNPGSVPRNFRKKIRLIDNDPPCRLLLNRKRGERGDACCSSWAAESYHTAYGQ